MSMKFIRIFILCLVCLSTSGLSFGDELPKAAQRRFDYFYLEAVRMRNLGKYAEDRDNLQDFVTSWYDAKRHYTLDTPLDVLNLSVQFYATAQDANVIKLSEKQIVNLDTASSGIQSIVPLLTLFD